MILVLMFVPYLLIDRFLMAFDRSFTRPFMVLGYLLRDRDSVVKFLRIGIS